MEDIYDKVYEALRSDYNKFLQCFYVWIEVNRYYDEPIPESCNEFSDWSSLIYCTMQNSHITNHLFNFNLEQL